MNILSSTFSNADHAKVLKEIIKFISKSTVEIVNKNGAVKGISHSIVNSPFKRDGTKFDFYTGSIIICWE